ncbi:hypothetical protein GCM10008098_06740 [Rhodanobacter panaciterrae]|uniref:Uncharacterized protein n=1 Tax=Rhodanobacter panaciterrae TaxID=490572 RepID=A0ABQ2ZM45_9GAMM|nr:hypothetical protein GCM10008098_06740 [Rhodanobacter panaciterrae]
MAIEQAGGGNETQRRGFSLRGAGGNVLGGGTHGNSGIVCLNLSILMGIGAKGLLLRVPERMDAMISTEFGHTRTGLRKPQFACILDADDAASIGCPPRGSHEKAERATMTGMALSSAAQTGAWLPKAARAPAPSGPTGPHAAQD